MKCGLWKYHKSPFSLTFFPFFHHPSKCDRDCHIHLCGSHTHKILFSSARKLKIWVCVELWGIEWKEIYYYIFHARSHEDENEVRNLCFYDFVCLCRALNFLKVRCTLRVLFLKNRSIPFSRLALQEFSSLHSSCYSLT